MGEKVCRSSWSSLLCLVCFCQCVFVLIIVKQVCIEKRQLHVSQWNSNDSFGNENSNLISQTHRHNLRYHRSYLLALGYSEQLSAAFHSMLQLSGLAYDWKAHLVEPTLVRSHIFGVRGIYPPFIDEKSLGIRDELPFFDIFNKSRVNQLLHSNVSQNLSMVSFQDFLFRAPRDIVLIHFNIQNINQTKRLFTLSKEEVSSIDSAFVHGGNETIFYCDIHQMKILRMYAKKIEKQFEKMSLQEHYSSSGYFRVNHVLCLNPKGIYRSNVLSQYLVSPATVIFTNWHGCAFLDCSQTNTRLMRAKYNPDPFRYAIITNRKFPIRYNNKFTLFLPVIEDAALAYLKFINYAPLDYVSIHIRAERIIRNAMENKIDDYQPKCAKKLLDLLSDMFPGKTESDQPLFKGSNSVMVTSDSFSLYGSDSCSGRNCKQIEVTKFHNLMKHNFDFTYYEPPNGTTHNSGFVSLVEMHMLALGAKLILVGTEKGGFQKSLVELFLSKGHTGSDIHRVMCSNF